MGLAAQLPEIDEAGPVRELGDEIDATAQDAFDIIAGVSEIWFKLTDTYEAPEAPKIHAGMRDPLKMVQDNKKIAYDIKQALHEYADKLDKFKDRKRQLEIEIAAAESDLAAAEAMPETKTETDSEGNEHEVPNDERERAIADAQAKLDRLADEVKKLCDDVKGADEELSWRIDNFGAEPPEPPQEAPEGESGRKSSNPVFSFLKGAKDSLVDTGKALWSLGVLAKDGAVSAWKNRKQIFEATKKLDDFVKNGGLGRMADATGKAVSNFSPRDAASSAWNGTKNWAKNEWQEFKDDPAYYVGYLAPDLIGTVASGGTAGAAKVGVTVAAKSTVKAATAGGVRAALKTGAKEGGQAFVAQRAKAATRQSVTARVVASTKSATAGGYNKVASAVGLSPITRSAATNVSGRAGDVMSVGTREAREHASGAVKTGAGQVRHGVSDVAETATKRVDEAPAKASRASADSAAGTAERSAASKSADAGEAASRPQKPRLDESQPEPKRSNTGASDSSIDDIAEEAVEHSDDASKRAASHADTTDTASGAGSNSRTGAATLLDETDEVAPKRGKTDADEHVDLEDAEKPVRRTEEPDVSATAVKDAPEGTPHPRPSDDGVSTTKQVDNADATRAAVAAEKTGAGEALDSADDIAKTTKDDIADIDGVDGRKADKPDASAPVAKEAAETTADHTGSAARASGEVAENAATHADDVADKGKHTPDSDAATAAKNSDEAPRVDDGAREKSAGTAVSEVGEHADDAPRASNAARGEDVEIVDGRKAAGIDVNEEAHAAEKADLLKPHEDGPLGEARDTIDTAHKPVDDSHFSRHHHADEAATLAQKPNVSADEFYKTTAREELIERARMQDDMDRVAKLEKLDADKVRAEYHQLKFDEYAEKRIASGEEFDFENNLKKRPEDEWRGTKIDYSVNEGAYVKDNSSLLPETLPEKKEWKRGEAPNSHIRVVDYVNENMREVTIQIGRNKVVYRHYPDYIESEAIIFDKFAMKNRLDEGEANKALMDAGAFTMDPETGEKLMRTDRPTMPVDEKGHLLAHMFAPNVGSGNYMAQHHDVNHETIYNIEMIIGDAVQNENSYAHYSTRATLDSTGRRPTAYHATVDLYDRETGRQWMRVDGAVHNDEHDLFHRDPKKTQVETYGRDLRKSALSGVKANALGSGAVPWFAFDQVNHP